MNKVAQSKTSIESFDIITSISHGKHAAISSRTLMSNGAVSNPHDLYEFTSTGSAAKLLKIVSYPVDGKL